VFSGLLLRGGEATLHPHFEEIIDLANSLFLAVQVFTNGYEISDCLLKKRDSYHNVRLQISLDSLNEKEHDYNRGVIGAFSKTYNNIKKYISYSYPIGISSVITGDNFDAMKDLCEHFKDEPMVHFLFAYVEKCDKWSRFDLEEYKSFLNFRKILYSKYPYKIRVATEYIETFEDVGICKAFDQMIVINPKGFLRPCPMFFDDSYNFGNVFQNNSVNFFDKYFLKINEYYEKKIHPLKGICKECEYKYYCKNCWVKKLSCLKV